jgi:hypothetical protein
MRRTATTVPSVLLFAVLTSLLLTVPGCGGGGGGGGSTLGLTRVQADESRSAKATVGAQGGTVTATGANGVRYTLTVPPNALRRDTEITLVPVTSIQDVGFSGGLAGAVHMLPEGLQFSAPAELTMELPAGTDAKTLKAFGYVGDGQEPHLQPATPAGTILTIPVMHFSGVGAGAGTQQLPPGSSNTTFSNQVSLLVQLSFIAPEAPPAASVYVDELRAWYTSSIKPGLEAVPLQADDDQVYSSLRWYQVWRHYANGTGLPAEVGSEVVAALAPERAEAADIAAESLRQIIAAYNQICTDQTDLRYAKKAIYYWGWAETLGLATQNRQLDQAKILNDLCVKVKLDAQFPEDLSAGESGHLVVKAGYSIAGGETKYDKIMAVTVIPDFTTDNTQRGGLVNDGQHTTFEGDWTRSSDTQPLQLHVIARFTDQDLLDVFSEVYKYIGGSPDITDTYEGSHTGVRSSSGTTGEGGRASLDIRQDSILLYCYRGQTTDFTKVVFILGSDPPFTNGEEQWQLSGNTLTAKGRVYFSTTSFPRGTGTLTATLSPDRSTLTGTATLVEGDFSRSVDFNVTR